MALHLHCLGVLDDQRIGNLVDFLLTIGLQIPLTNQFCIPFLWIKLDGEFNFWVVIVLLLLKIT